MSNNIKVYASEDFVKEQLANISTEGLATETYVNNQITSLVNSAPEKLNTINELAAALGDDENFANTVTTELSKKANTTDLTNYASKSSLSSYLPYGAKLLTTNPFATNKELYISKIDNALYCADKRWTCTSTIYSKADDSLLYSSTLSNCSLFKGKYDSVFQISAGQYTIVKIDCGESQQISSYPYGDFFMSFYYGSNPESVSWRCYRYSSTHGEVGWSEWEDMVLDATLTRDSVSGDIYRAHTDKYAISAYEFKVVAPDDSNAWVAQLEFAPSRPDSDKTPFVSKYIPETLYYELTAPSFNGLATKATNDALGNNIANTYATKDFVNIRVPTWTSTDEGKVLKIVNGTPTWS